MPVIQNTFKGHDHRNLVLLLVLQYTFFTYFHSHAVQRSPGLCRTLLMFYKHHVAFFDFSKLYPVNLQFLEIPSLYR